MGAFSRWLCESKESMDPLMRAVEAHYRLVTIHPFVDGNGRTARLLMNLLLMQAGYPPAVVRMRDRLSYLTSLEKAQTGGSKEDYERLMYQAVGRSLDMYLKAMKGDLYTALDEELLKIGALSKETGETPATLRYWTKEGLLEVHDYSPGGYHLYASSMVERVKQIQDLKKKRFTLKEVKDLFKRETNDV